MPYIPEADRERYDDSINDLADKLNDLNGNDEISGHMNYIIFRLALRLTTLSCGGEKRYARMAVATSSMTEARDEFKRRYMAPYEDQKILKEGDVKP